MQVKRGLITTVSEFQEFLTDVGSMSGEAFIPNTPTSIILAGSDDKPIMLTITHSEPSGDNKLQNPKVNVIYDGYLTRLIGDNESAISLAYEIRASASGDTLVKFAQWTGDEPLDIFKETFQSWGIAAYTTTDPSIGTDTTSGERYARFLSYKNLGVRDLLAGQNYGGFLVNRLASGNYGITVFNRDTVAPIYMWAPGAHLCLEDGVSYVNTGGRFSSYTERKRRYYGLTSNWEATNVLVQEPYDHPKRPTYAILAPIFTLSVDGDYTKTSRWLLQSPHMYNPFDSDGYVLIDGGDGGSFYSDHGVCLSAKGDKIVSTGEVIPALNTWLHHQMGDFDRLNERDPGIYGEVAINYDGTIYDPDSD